MPATAQLHPHLPTTCVLYLPPARSERHTAPPRTYLTWTEHHVRTRFELGAGVPFLAHTDVHLLPSRGFPRAPSLAVTPTYHDPARYSTYTTRGTNCTTRRLRALAALHTLPAHSAPRALLCAAPRTVRARRARARAGLHGCTAPFRFFSTCVDAGFHHAFYSRGLATALASFSLLLRAATRRRC